MGSCCQTVDPGSTYDLAVASAALCPPCAVLSAFAVTDDPVVLPGGQGRTWRAGEVILKPVEFMAETVWRAEVLTELADSPRFRVARPVRARDGRWVVGGWEACGFVAGDSDVERPDEVMRAGLAFHAAIAGLPRPAFLDWRHDPWDYGDRVAWQEVPMRVSPRAMPLLEPLLRCRRPVTLDPQLVHGDLAGNVLFADGLPPAIIDWPVYWRPAAWALAVVVADALCWYRAVPALAARWSHLPAWDQMLVRALIYRIVTHDAAHGTAGWTPDQIDAYRPVVELAVGNAGRSADARW